MNSANCIMQKLNSQIGVNRDDLINDLHQSVSHLNISLLSCEF